MLEGRAAFQMYFYRIEKLDDKNSVKAKQSLALEQNNLME